MKSIAPKELCLSLLHADSANDVIEILSEAGYWDNPHAWRLYGDKEGNFAQAGNQQSLPEAALVEKVINSVDARLMMECRVRGIDPESDSAPANMRDAVAMFFENRRAENDEGGTLINWSNVKRTEQSHHITIAATGSKPTKGRTAMNMCLTIADQGEGQSPMRLPSTILSLNAKNKQRIRFVQGKFNMGGSGALRFCKEGIQLIISRRHPNLAAKEVATDPSVEEWGFTVVRREEPSNESGQPVHSEFTYLAPQNIEASPNQGGVLSFAADSLPLMPIHNDAYVRDVEWATVIKMYEYETNGGQSNVILPDGLLFALERLMPEIALPVRLHECRAGYKGTKKKSFGTPISGLVVRLEDGKGDNVEDGFPLSVLINTSDMKMRARIYAFKEKRAKTYLKNEGVIFAINGQAHGNLPKSIFARPKAVGLTRLRDSLLVLVDCSLLRARQREDLFMSSRDRLSKNPIRYELEHEIEDLLRNNPALRRLQNERRDKDTKAKLDDDRPLEEVLGKIFKSSPTLRTLFLHGQRLSKPFPRGGGTKPGNGGGSEHPDRPFEGLRHPTVFKIHNQEYGKEYRRNCEQERRFRIKFETDVENGYFERATDKGIFDVDVVDESKSMSPINCPNNIVLVDGIATLSMLLPPEADVGDYLVIQATVTDPTLPQPFVNIIRINVIPKQIHPSGTKKSKPGGNGTGTTRSNDGISTPEVIPVHEGDDNWNTHGFKASTACKVISEPVEIDQKDRLSHTFYINMDNTSLRTEMKHSKDSRLIEAKFTYANVLLGLGMLHVAYGEESPTDGNDENEQLTIEEKIDEFSAAVAPVILPMIDQLAGLDSESLGEFSLIGDDE